MDGKSKNGTVDTSNENDLSLSVLVSFGAFREEIGGDLSGDNTNMYQDVETPVAKDVGPIDVYKVHHDVFQLTPERNDFDVLLILTA